MKIIVNGAAGHMGRILCRLIGEREGLELVARVDVSGADGCLSAPGDFDGDADIVIDFSHHTSAPELARWAADRGIPLMVCTTGHTEEEKAAIAAAAASVPVFFAANMSPAVALLADMAARTARLFPEADIEIVEAHHNRKTDVPSGTALMLAEAVAGARADARFVVGRHENGRREKRDIGIHSLRMGNVVGMHEIIIHTGTEAITLKHEAEDRALFAEGALKAAEFLVRQNKGLYTMRDMIDKN